MTTLVDFFRNAERCGRPDLLRTKRDGRWTSISAAEFGETVRAVSSALAAFGVGRGDRVAILSENRPEWSIVDFAALCHGAVTVPIYTTYGAPQARELLVDSGACAAFGSRGGIEKLLAVRRDCPDLRTVVALDDDACPEGARPFGAFAESGRRGDPAAFDREADAVRPDDLATLIYTSGTTGEPKGAMLTHGNLASDVAAGLSVLPLRPEDVALSFLPLAHIFERELEYAYFASAVPIAYVEAIDRVGEAMLEAKPTVFGAVPRVYEKVRDRVLENVAKGPAFRRALFRSAMATGAEIVARRESGRPPGFGLALRHRIFDRLVFSKIRARLGGRFRFSVSGGGPLGRETAEFFWAAGISVFEGYGLTETSPVVSVNRFDAWRLGSVGRVLPGVEVAIAEDGEIRVRGPIVMKGYWRKPAETREAIDAEGWFSTGDVGAFDADGFLHITDRKKDLLVNAYGKNVAPAPIEAALAALPFVASAVVIGDRRPYLTALIVPRFDRIESWAAERGIRCGSRGELAADPRVVALVHVSVEGWNAGRPNEQRIRRFTLLTAEPTVDGGELTPTLKVRRNAIARRCAAEIEAMYALRIDAGNASEIDAMNAAPERGTMAEEARR